MEMNILSQLMPAMQTKVALSPPGGGQPSAGFAGLLAMLQQLPGLGPEAAIVASQLAGTKEQAGSLPKLLAALLPQLMPQQVPAVSASPPVREDGGTAGALLWLPAALQGLPLQPAELAGGGTNGEANFGGANVPQPGNVLQAVAAAKQGAEKLLPEPAAMLQDVAAVKLGVENLLPEALPEGQEGQNDAPADKPTATAKPVPEQELPLPWQRADKAVVDLPVSRAIKSEQFTTTQGSPVLGYQTIPGRVALPTAAAQFAQSPLARLAVAEQVLEKMVFRRELEGDSTLSVRLKPAALGEVQINLRLEDGRLMARIMTENLFVKEALDAALGQVKQRLEAQQIQVAELTVTVGQQQDFRQDRTSGPFWQQAEGKSKRSPGTATVSTDGAGSQPVGLLQGLVDARV